MQRFEKQTPNKTILGLKFHLWVYNLAKPNKNKGISGWLHRIGEEPVLFDPVLTDQTTEQFKKHLVNQGYYHAAVHDSIEFKGKKAIVRYYITLNKPYRIKNIQYQFEDQSIKDIIYADTVNSLVKVGNRFDADVLAAERVRVETYMKNHGYYKFSRDNIYYTAEKDKQTNWVDLTILIKQSSTGIPDPETKIRMHHQYKIANTYIFPNSTLFYTKNSQEDHSLTDTIRIDHYFIVYQGRHNIKPAALLMPNLCRPGNLYNLNDVQKTNNNYSSLGLFRVINVNFKDDENIQADTGKYRYVNCFIELTPRKDQSFKYEVVGTHSYGDFGGRINILYNNYNLFRNAENLQNKITGAVEGTQNRYKVKGPMLELGFESQLTLTKFLIPKILLKFNPKTTFNIMYNYQNQPAFVRTQAGASYGYQWKGNKYNKNYFVPLDFTYTGLPKGLRDSTFASDIKRSSSENNYRNHTILSLKDIFEYSNQVPEKNRDFIFFRGGLEWAGLGLKGLSNAFFERKDTLFKVPFNQYIKTDLEFRYNNLISPDNRIVYRLTTGIGYPLWSSQTLPLERQYAAGGPDDIRAWSTNKLGPGSVPDSLRSAYPRGDIRLEGNVEYRFKLFWDIEGALFVDAGNIWNAKKLPNQPGGEFRWNRFYKQIAVGTGFGLRFNFSFVILRTDFGWKMRDPSIQEGSRWIDWNKTINKGFKDRINFQLGIGYPF